MANSTISCRLSAAATRGLPRCEYSEVGSQDLHRLLSPLLEPRTRLMRQRTLERRAGREGENMFIRTLFLLLACTIALRQAIADERPTNPGVGPETFELVPYQSSEYKFLILSPSETPPVDFPQPDFDATSFRSGNAAFGGGTGGDCPLEPTVQTSWPLNSQLLVRRDVNVPRGATNVRILVAVDNDIESVWFNGAQISGPIHHEGCPIRDEFRLDVPNELVRHGHNLVAFHVRDRTAPINESFFDFRILAEVTLAQTSKSLHELARNLDKELPRAAVSDIVTSCSTPSPGGQDAQQIFSTSFVVGATQEPGEINVVQLTPDTFREDFIVDKQLMFTATSGTREFTSSIPPNVTLDSRADLMRWEALATMLSRAEVTSPMFECLRTNSAAPTCQETIRSAGRTCRALCWGGIAGAAATGAAGGSIFGPFGTGVGAVLGAIAGGVAESLCSDHCTEIENDRIKQCPH
jgi:hypothetical protein